MRHANSRSRFDLERWIDERAGDDPEHLEELQRDLEEAAADVAERIRRNDASEERTA